MRLLIALLLLTSACNPFEEPLDIDCLTLPAPQTEQAVLGIIDENDEFEALADRAELRLLAASGGGRLVQLAARWYGLGEDNWGHEFSFRANGRRVGEREVIVAACTPGWTQLTMLGLKLDDQSVTEAELHLESGPSVDGQTFSRTTTTSVVVTFR